jgi:hypothetical protein
MLNRTVSLLAGIRESDDQLELAAEIDKALSALITNLGPELLLSKIHLLVGFQFSYGSKLAIKFNF